tara:strand:- start:20603 stop:20728 length:126 start_codon:yes stop_codon:yes gene_type:complete
MENHAGGAEVDADLVIVGDGPVLYRTSPLAAIDTSVFVSTP